MEYLSKLLGSPGRVKILRFFIFNPLAVFDRDMLVKQARVTPDTASKELASLARAGIIDRKTYYKEVVRPGTKIPKKRKTLGWMLDQNYPHLAPLTRFLRETLSVSFADIRKRMRGAGSIRLLVISGFLTGQREGGLDMLVVGDRLDDQMIKEAVRSFEAELGRDIGYAILSTDEYKYRRGVRDKLVRDVMDFPHEVLIDRLTE